MPETHRYGHRRAKKSGDPMSERVITNASWIQKVFKNYLKPVPRDALVFALAVGNCEELPYIRDFAGQEATIHAFDTLFPIPTADRYIQSSRTNYHKANIQNIDSVITTAGGIPDLIICRAPQILNTISPLEVTYNNWWFDVLTQFAKKLKANGQMLITTYAEQEQRLMADYMKKKGLNPITNENLLWPHDSLVIQGPDGPISGGPDRFTIVIKN